MCTSTCPGCASHTIPAVLEGTSASQLKQSLPLHVTAQLDKCSARGSPHFVLSSLSLLPHLPLHFSLSCLETRIT